MSKPVARYAVYFGLEGCYLPDSTSGPYEFTTRSELAEFIRDQLAFYDLPAYLFNEVRITRLWSFIKQHGSSTAHFGLSHKGMRLAFSGLTEEEFQGMESEFC